MKHPLNSLALSLCLLASAPLAASTPLRTVAEQSGWKTTGRYAEVETLCAQFPKQFAGKVRCERFGTTPEGRPMFALVAGASEHRKNPVIFFQGGIHAGEIDGKDAGFWFLREWLSGKEAVGSLGKVTVVFIPVFNVDGHERFGPNNRVNQVGPEEMGHRVTAQNLNLNRDYTKLDSPEMVALLGLARQYDPTLWVDLHVTDGAKFQHDVAVLVEPRRFGPESLRPVASALQEALFPPLVQRGHQPLDFYPQFTQVDDPASGFGHGAVPPRLSHGYFPLRNRLAILVETHSWKDYATRVKTTYDIFAQTVRLAATQGALWRQAEMAADAEDQKPREEPIPLNYQTHAPATMVAFQGYAYTRTPSPISGEVMVRYDESKPQVWNVPVLTQVVPTEVSAVPRNKGGYLIPPAQAWLVEKLKLHGFSVQRLPGKEQPRDVEVFRSTQAQFKPAPFEGRTMVTVQGSWTAERRSIPAGSFFVPANQPGRFLLLQLLEPLARDSFLAWGFFNAWFEQKEYMESYVAEQVGEKMLKENPEVKTEFDNRLAKDPAFAKDPAARLEFFYRKHPSWDDRVNLYPVFRMNSAP